MYTANGKFIKTKNNGNLNINKLREHMSDDSEIKKVDEPEFCKNVDVCKVVNKCSLDKCKIDDQVNEIDPFAPKVDQFGELEFNTEGNIEPSIIDVDPVDDVESGDPVGDVESGDTN